MTAVNPRTAALARSGVSLWLDDLSRELLDTGRFREYVDRFSVTGATSNPSIFAKALRDRDRYTGGLARIRAALPDALPGEVFLRLALADVGEAAELLRPTHEASGGRDGYVSFECTPDVAHDTQATVDQALELAGRLAAHPNTMIKVPATDAGVGAIEELTAGGVNVNVTLLFSVARYEQIAEAFLRGLERRAAAGLALDGIHSVASFFVSRVDAKADTRLPAHSRLRGRVAVLNARAAHRRYLAVLSGSRWKALAAKGANPQRPLWASMAPKSDEYTDVFYLDALAFPGSVATVPRETLHAYAHHGNPERAGPPPSDDRDHADLASAVDLAAIARELEREGLEAFAAAYEEILGALRTEDEGHAALRY